MNFEKRSEGQPESQGTPETDKPSGDKKPVVIYIMILFVVAFLLMALSFLMHQRSNSEVLGELQDSVTAMQEVQASQEALLALQSELQDAQDTIDELQESAETNQEALTAAQTESEALLALYTLQQQYAARDLPACRETIQSMEENALVQALPAEASGDIASPAQRFEQLKAAVTALENP